MVDATHTIRGGKGQAGQGRAGQGHTLHEYSNHSSTLIIYHLWIGGDQHHQQDGVR